MKKNILRKLAKGQGCKVRLPGICNYDTDTTVLAHLGGAGIGRKHHDMLGAWACSSCHDEVDRRTMRRDLDFVQLHFYHAILKTQMELLEMGFEFVMDGED